nr:hypothetical protein [Pseudomonas abietaniphila]
MSGATPQAGQPGGKLTEFQSLGHRLVRFGQALQSEATTVAELTRLANACGISLRLRATVESGEQP